MVESPDRNRENEDSTYPRIGGHAATVANKGIFLIGGGRHTNGVYELSKEVHLIDHDTNQCKTIESAAIQRLLQLVRPTAITRRIHNKEEIIVFGGTNLQRVRTNTMIAIGMDKYDTVSLKLIKSMNEVPGRSSHTAHYIKEEDAMVVLFGLSSVEGESLKLVEMFKFTEQRWVDMTPPITSPSSDIFANSEVSLNNDDSSSSSNTPCYRVHHVSIQYLDTTIIVFGGLCPSNDPSNRDGGKFLNDVWAFDVSRRSWQSIETSGQKPTPRSSAAAVMYDDKMFIIGGRSPSLDEEPLSRAEYIYFLDLQTNVWSCIHEPYIFKVYKGVKIFNHVAEVMNDHIYIHGGFVLSGKQQNHLIRYPLLTLTQKFQRNLLVSNHFYDIAIYFDDASSSFRPNPDLVRPKRDFDDNNDDTSHLKLKRLF